MAPARSIIIFTAIPSDDGDLRRYILLGSLNQRSGFRPRASKKISRSLTSASLVTTEPVLIEYLNYFAAWGQEFRLMASASAKSMLSSSTVIVIPLTAELFQAGVDLYAARPDKGYSLTDCISMVAMRQQASIRTSITRNTLTLR
jgi:uncharacterized protein